MISRSKFFIYTNCIYIWNILLHFISFLSYIYIYFEL
jgi:hypothetical protein